MDFGLTAGEELEVATTLCSEVRDARAPIVIGHASKDPNYCDHPTPKRYGIESYIAVPIIQKNGEVFGTLCAIDSRPADLSNGTIVESMILFAGLLANELGNEESYCRPHGERNESAAKREPYPSGDRRDARIDLLYRS
jgi:GAF domain-containing protein